MKYLYDYSDICLCLPVCSEIVNYSYDFWEINKLLMSMNLFAFL